MEKHPGKKFGRYDVSELVEAQFEPGSRQRVFYSNTDSGVIFYSWFGCTLKPAATPFSFSVGDQHSAGIEQAKFSPARAV